MALVYNYNEYVTAVAFISGLQVTHPFYKHLVKNDITKIRDILVQAQKCVQIEEGHGPTPVISQEKGSKSRSQSYSSPEEESMP